MKTVIAIASLAAGCFAEVRGAGLAPTRHGYGDAGGQALVTVGSDQERDFGRIGIGVSGYGYRSTSDDGLRVGGLGLHLRGDLTLHELSRMVGTRSLPAARRVIAISTLSLGLAEVTSEPNPSSGFFFDAFAGIGYSNDTHVYRWRFFSLAAGAAANRLWPDEGSPVWFVGFAVQAAIGWAPKAWNDDE